MRDKHRLFDISHIEDINKHRIFIVMILSLVTVPIRSATIRTEFASNVTSAVNLSTNTPELTHNKTGMKLCQFAIDSTKADELHRKFQKYLKHTRPGVFYVNFLYQHNKSEHVKFERQQESGVFLWSLVKQRWKFLLTYPVDLHVVTFGTIRGGSVDEYVSITLKNPNECFMYYSYAVNDMRNLIRNQIVRNSSNNEDIKVCHRQFQNQSVKILWYQFTRIWDGYQFECYNVTCLGNNCADTLPMSPITVVVYILCSLSFLFYPLIFSIVKRDKMTDPKWMNRYHRNKDTPFGFHRLKMRYFFVSPIKDNNVVPKTYIPECRLILLILIVLLTAYIARPILDKKYFGKKILRYPEVYIPNDQFRKLYVLFLNAINVELFTPTEMAFFSISSLGLAFVLYLFHVIAIKINCEEDDFIIVLDPVNPFWKKQNSWRISVSDFAVEGNKKTGGIAEMFYKRMALAFTLAFWQFIISKSFGLGKNICECCPIKCVKVILRVFCMCLLFIVMIFNIVFNFVTCFVPIIWLLVGTPIKIYFHRNKNTERKWSEVLIYFSSYLVIFTLSFVFLVDLIIRSVAFMTKIFTYFLFVAIPSFPIQQVRVVLIIVSSITYLGRYIKGFLTAYEKMLSLIFEAEDSLLKEDAEKSDDDGEGEKQTTADEIEFIPIEEFEYVCTNTFPVGLQIFSLVAKIFVTGMFLFTAITALQNSGNFTTTRRTNFLEILSLIFIIMSPTVAEIALSVSLEEEMEMQKTEITALVKKWNEIRNKSVNKNLFVVNEKLATTKLHIAETRNKQFTQQDTIIQCCGCCKSVIKTNICLRLGYYLLFVFCCCFRCDKDGRCVFWRYMKDSTKSGGKYITKRGSIYGRKVRAVVLEFPCLNLKESNEVIHPWEDEESEV